MYRLVTHVLPQFRDPAVRIFKLSEKYKLTKPSLVSLLIPPLLPSSKSLILILRFTSHSLACARVNVARG
jgi:hypothetical protein